MTAKADDNHMKPLLILPVGEISKKDIARLNRNGFCVVEAKVPSNVRFAEPPPMQYDAHDKAAIELFRVLMARTDGTSHNRKELAAMYVDLLLAGVRPQPVTPVARVSK
jgi:hypothetical protein